MKINVRRLRIALLAMMMSLAMTMGTFACDDYYYELGGYDAYEGPEAYDDYWYDECDWEDEDEFAYMYEDGYWDDFENWLDADGSSEGHIISYDDLSESAVIDNDVFEFVVLPEMVKSTDATVSAYVLNPTGKTVTSVGLTLYYNFGEVARSTVMGCDCDYDEINMEFVLSDILGEDLDHGVTYKYRFFFEADGQLYTHDLDHFETNMTDDKFEVMHEVCSATSGTVSIDATVYNWDYLPVEEFGCKLGEYSFELDRDYVTGDFSDYIINSGFDLEFPNGQYESGATYNYEIYVVSEGKTYIVGRDSFTIY